MGCSAFPPSYPSFPLCLDSMSMSALRVARLILLVPSPLSSLTFLSTWALLNSSSTSTLTCLRPFLFVALGNGKNAATFGSVLASLHSPDLTLYPRCISSRITSHRTLCVPFLIGHLIFLSLHILAWNPKGSMCAPHGQNLMSPMTSNRNLV